MPVNKNAAFRYRVIDTCLRNPRRRHPSLTDIQDAVTEALNLKNTISASSIHKDFKFMRDHYKAPIIYDKTESGYRYDDKDFSINSFPLTTDEITALDMSIAFLKQIRHSGFFSEYESAIEKIISGFRISQIEGYEKKRFIETEEPTIDTGISWLETLYNAIVFREVVRVEYRKFNTTESRMHLLSPYIIREYRNRWYVTGHTDLTQALVTLSLDRILGIEATKERFEQIPTFDEDNFLKHAFGVTTYPDTEPSKVLLLFDRRQLGYMESRPIHRSQRIFEDPRGFLMELECHVTPELEMFILSLGEHVKVLGPIGLEERIKRRIEAMGLLYL